MPDTTPTQHEPMLTDLMLGFEALTKKVDELVAKNTSLEKQLNAYTQQESVPILPKPARQGSDQVHSTAPTSVSEWRDNECFAPGLDAWKKLKEIRGRNVDAERLERDFTTAGRVGDLRCPFTQRAARRLSRGTASSRLRPTNLPTPPCIREECGQDPIAAEFHPDIIHSPPASVENAAAKCPIRFLDDHSPEEVAKYFENHKHEIPRSHEVCVKRYGTNAESVKELDAKYGNLVNMIQGLGVKHQPMLPTAEDGGVDQKSMDKVEQWAEDVKGAAPPEQEVVCEDDAKSDLRTGHFERPLQEVRLGESPSRPWGIQVPAEKQRDGNTAASADSNAAQSIAAAVASQAETEPMKQCPFAQFASTMPSGHPPVEAPIRAASRAAEAPLIAEEAAKPIKPAAQQGIVFNGPVFFGYSADEIGKILTGLNGTKG